jgi:hypothetical protein
MALSIGVSRGDRIRVGQHLVEVASTYRGHVFICVDGGEPLKITESQQQILPGVKIFLGIGPNGQGNRLAFIADRNILINRIGEHFNAEMLTAGNVALFAPVPHEHLLDGIRTVQREGKVAFGSMKWELFRELDSLRKGQFVDVYIYASHITGDLNLTASWKGRYIGHKPSLAGAHPDGMRYRPESTGKYHDDNAGHWAVFWEIDRLNEVAREHCLEVTDLISLRTGKHYPASPPEGPMLIEHP